MSDLDKNKPYKNWRLERVLGSGTFGKVMLMKNNHTGERIAIKKCHSETSNNIDQSGWKREIEILHKLQHPGLVSALAVPEGLEVLANEAPLLCMEYCSGGDLRQLLNQPSSCCGLPERDVLQILNQISSALSYLHSAQIVHRDLKPENIVIQCNENKEKMYKLIDLGFAKNLNQQSLCHTLVGTLQYLAPELFSGEKYTNTVDYWSLGLIVHECITGVRPFLPGLPPIQWMQQVELKSHDDICVYISPHPEGNVIFSTRLFKENHLSSVMQLMMEDWLRSMLEWDPVLRGRDYPQDPNHLGPVVAFDKLERMAKTEVAYIFWVEGLAHLCYQVGEDVSMEEIYEWIERDTGVGRQYQLIVLPRGQCPDPTKSARQLLISKTNPDDGEEPPNTACLFSKYNDGSECRLTQSYPEFLEVMLSNPRQVQDYRTQKRMWAQSVFFVGHQNSLHKKLLQTLKTLSAYMMLRAALLKQQMEFITISLRHSSSCHELFADSLKLDKHNYQLQSQRGGLPSSALLEKWSNEEIMLHNRLGELQSRCSMVEQLLTRELSAAGEAAKAASVFLCKPSDGLAQCAQNSLDLHGELLKRSKEERQLEKDNIVMTKVVVKALKFRNQLFTDCFTRIRIVEKCSAEVDSFAPQLFVLKSDIDQFQDQMLLLQNQRQNDIWTLLERAVTLWQRTSMINQHGSQTSPTKDEAALLSIPILGAVENSAHESLMTIQENQKLRYQVQDSLAKGLSSTCTATPYNLDWSFLNKDL